MSTCWPQRAPASCVGAELGAERGAAHVHASVARAPAPGPVRYSTERSPPERLHRRRSRPAPGRRRPPPGPGSGSRCRSSRPPAVGVAQVHGQRGRARCPTTARSTPSAPMPRCRSHRARTSAADRGRRSSGSSSTRKSLPAPWCLVRRSAPRASIVVSLAPRRPTRCPSDRAAEPDASHTSRSCASEIAVGIEPRDAGVAPEPRPLAAGEGPGPPHGLVHGLVEGHPLLHVGQQLAVAERLAGGARQPAGARGQGADLVDEPGVEQLPEALARCGRRGRPGRSGCPPGRTAWAGRRRARARTTRRAGPHRGSPRGPARPGGGWSAPSGPRPPGRARPAGRAGAAVPPGRRPPLRARRRPRGTGRAPTAGRPRPAGRARSRPRAGPGAPGLRCRRSDARASAWNRPSGELLVRVDQVDQVVRHLGPLGAHWAWPCRCPCPGTRTSSRPTPARPRVAGGPAPGPAPTCPTPSAPTSATWPGAT